MDSETYIKKRDEECIEAKLRDIKNLKYQMILNAELGKIIIRNNVIIW